MLRPLALVILCTGLTACMHGPTCDYTELVGSCAPSIDSDGDALFVRAMRCAEVDLEINGEPRTIRTTKQQVYVADTGDAAEIKGCRAYRDLEGL